MKRILKLMFVVATFALTSETCAERCGGGKGEGVLKNVPTWLQNKTLTYDLYGCPLAVIASTALGPDATCGDVAYNTKKLDSSATKIGQMTIKFTTSDVVLSGDAKMKKKEEGKDITAGDDFLAASANGGCQGAFLGGVYTLYDPLMPDSPPELTLCPNLDSVDSGGNPVWKVATLESGIYKTPYLNFFDRGTKIILDEAVVVDITGQKYYQSVKDIKDGMVGDDYYIDFFFENTPDKPKAKNGLHGKEKTIFRMYFKRNSATNIDFVPKWAVDEKRALKCSNTTPGTSTPDCPDGYDTIYGGAAVSAPVASSSVGTLGLAIVMPLTYDHPQFEDTERFGQHFQFVSIK